MELYFCAENDQRLFDQNPVLCTVTMAWSLLFQWARLKKNPKKKNNCYTIKTKSLLGTFHSQISCQNGKIGKMLLLNTSFPERTRRKIERKNCGCTDEFSRTDSTNKQIAFIQKHFQGRPICVSLLFLIHNRFILSHTGWNCAIQSTYIWLNCY